MDEQSIPSIRQEIAEIRLIPVANRVPAHFQRLNDLEAEIRRRQDLQAPPPHLHGPPPAAGAAAGGGPTPEELAASLVPHLLPLLRERLKHRIVTVSGSATGVDSPAPAVVASDAVPVGGGRTLPTYEYMEAKRYFALFSDAIKHRYPQGGYGIVYNDKTGRCSVFGHHQEFRFDFVPAVIKNHYLTFRLLDSIPSYFEVAVSQQGISDHSLVPTPPSTGECKL